MIANEIEKSSRDRRGKTDRQTDRWKKLPSFGIRSFMNMKCSIESQSNIVHKNILRIFFILKYDNMIYGLVISPSLPTQVFRTFLSNI